MSYEAYKGHRLAPDDNGCWDVLDSDYQSLGTYPSKAAAKRVIDLTIPAVPDQAPQTLSIDDILIEVRHGRMSNTKAKTLIASREQAAELRGRIDELKVTREWFREGWETKKIGKRLATLQATNPEKEG